MFAASYACQSPMTTKVKPIPDGYEGATPYLICKDAARALEFYQRAFGATESMHMPMLDGKVGHAEIRIGRATVMLADEFPEMGVLAPQAPGSAAVSILIYVENVDALVARAVAAGATIQRPLADQFYGDRSCTLADPFGHVWTFATHQENVPLEEMKKRAASFGQK